MKTNEQLYADEHTIRIIAAFIIVITAITLITQSKILAAFLFIDFGVRAFTRKPSILAAAAKFIGSKMKFQPKPILAAPKKFAAKLGFIFSFIVFLSFLFEQTASGYIMGGILLFCVALESFLNICLGSYVFNWIITPIENQRRQQKSNE